MKYEYSNSMVEVTLIRTLKVGDSYRISNSLAFSGIVSGIVTITEISQGNLAWGVNQNADTWVEDLGHVRIAPGGGVEIINPSTYSVDVAATNEAVKILGEPWITYEYTDTTDIPKEYLEEYDPIGDLPMGIFISHTSIL